jgi:DNA-binding MarR family transcriptional regulator
MAQPNPRGRRWSSRGLDNHQRCDMILSYWKYAALEIPVSNPSHSSHAAQLAEVIRHFIRLKPRLRTVQPEDAEAAAIVARLAETQPDGATATSADFDLLYGACVVLAQWEPMTMGELSQTLAVPLSTATRLVNWLVKGGYVARFADAEDRRVVRVTLTSTGQAMVQAGNELICRRADTLLRGFTTTERDDLIRLLDKLARALEGEVVRSLAISEG